MEESVETLTPCMICGRSDHKEPMIFTGQFGGTFKAWIVCSWKCLDIAIMQAKAMRERSEEHE